MKEIDKLRKKINVIDKKLITLINNRAAIALKIGKAKNKNIDTNIFRPERQAEIIKNLIKIKANKLNANEIFILWKSIFYLQSKIQGTQEYIMPSYLKKNFYREIAEFFGNNIKINYTSSIVNSFNLTKKKYNRLLFLKYPGLDRSTNWWSLRELQGLYVVASIPLILKNENTPSLLILSKNSPTLSGENDYLYISKNIISKKKIKLVVKKKNLCLYISKNYIQDKSLKFIGAYPCNIRCKN